MIDIEELIEYTKNLTLLYVEDNADARRTTLMILEDFFDVIISAVDGQDGYEKFQENDIDLVISDINMPKLNGIEMCKKIREIDENIPLIILSAHNEDNFFISSIKININAYLLKPIDFEHLINTIQHVIEKYKYIAQSKKNLHLLHMYQKATNESSIVSKTDTKGFISYVNDAFCEISGYTREELIGKNHNIVRHPDNPKSIFQQMWHTIKEDKEIWKGIVRNQSKNGKSYYVDSLVMPITNLEGEILEYISLRNDITHIMNPIKQLQAAVKNFQKPILVYMKLNKFDLIEEFYDNEKMEETQNKIKIYLQNKFSNIFEFDTVYQLGNGEYAFLLQYEKYANSIDTLIQTLKKHQNIIGDDEIELNDISYDITVLISLVYENEKILESAKLGIKQLLESKKSFIIANNLANIKQEKAKENMRTVSMIQNSIDNSKIVSYCQGIIDNASEKVLKYESLVRLIDANNTVHAPYFFLETAKKSNQYTQITAIVLEQSFKILQTTDKDISINLSAIDIEHKLTRELILQYLKENSSNASRIIFELLEDENITDFEIIKEFIRSVKSFGVKIAIDDFGAGYSNYDRLLDYQPDILKIDGSLIRNIDTDAYSLSIVKSIVTFAKEQNLQTVAEFVENESIYKIVKNLGVDFSQGYYFEKPQPIEQKGEV